MSERPAKRMLDALAELRDTLRSGGDLVTYSPDESGKLVKQIVRIPTPTEKDSGDGRG